MLDFGRCSEEQLGAVREVVQALVHTASIDPQNLLLVGAQARDMLHAALGHSDQPTATSDVDLGFVVSSWTDYDAVVSALPSMGDSGIRYCVAGIPVDFMPFGDVANAAGDVRLANRQDAISVFGFAETFNASLELPVSRNLSIRIPSIPGFAALKLKAWIDRWAANWETKDARDIALILRWYRESPTVEERLFDVERDVLIRYELNAALGSAFLLGVDVREVLGPEAAARLAVEWERSDRSALARNLSYQNGVSPRSDAEVMVAALGAGIA